MASADSFFEAHSPGQATQSSPGSSPRRQGHLYKSIVSAFPLPNPNLSFWDAADTPLSFLQHPGDYNPKMDATKTGFKSMGVKEKRPKATFGQPLGTLRPDTMNYTKAHQGEPRLPQRANRVGKRESCVKEKCWVRLLTNVPRLRSWPAHAAEGARQAAGSAA